MHYKMLLCSVLIFHSFFQSVRSEITSYRDVRTNETLGENECWRFTWVGPYDEDEDSGKVCADFFPEDLCFPPLVFTNDTTGNGEPDLAALDEECNRLGQDCKCKRESSEVCVKYTKLSKDGVAVYYSSFCGSGVNKNNFGTDPVDSGCHRDKTSDVANNREVCFCQGPMCNESSVIKIKIDLLLVALLFSILCVYL